MESSASEVLRKFGWFGYVWWLRRASKSGKLKDVPAYSRSEKWMKDAARTAKEQGWGRYPVLRSVTQLPFLSVLTGSAFLGALPPEIAATVMVVTTLATHTFTPYDDAFLKLWLAKRAFRGYGEELARKLAEGRENELRAVELLRLWASEGKPPGALRDPRVREGISRALPYLTPEERRRIGADNLEEFMVKHNIPVLTKEDLKEAKKIRKFLER